MILSFKSFQILKVWGYLILTFDSDRRIRDDRRECAWFSIRLMIGNGKRRIIRRQADRGRLFFVDHYSQWFLFVILTIVLLSITDGLLTLFLLNHGASEANPVMAYFLKFGPFAFIAVKYSLTSFGVMVLLVFRNISIPRLGIRTDSFYYIFIGVFGAVVAFELYLIYNNVLWVAQIQRNNQRINLPKSVGYENSDCKGRIRQPGFALFYWMWFDSGFPNTIWSMYPNRTSNSLIKTDFFAIGKVYAIRYQYYWLKKLDLVYKR